MDFSPFAIAKLLIPKLPFILQTMVTNRLGWSPCSDKQDARTEIVVEIIRSVMRVSKPVGQLQAPTLRDPGIKGQMWIATAKCPAPDSHVRDAVVSGIRELGNGTETFDLPDIADVEGEWTGYRGGVDKKAPRPQLSSEREHYEHLMKETTSPVTILYFHGGAYFLLDPISHRALGSSLAKRTGGRCFSVRYRLAPQHPFPAQLVDALTAYLYLLSPPEGSFHDPVPASHIVFAGDSAGGNLSFALLLLILTLRRAGVTSVSFYGRDVPLDLPAGVSGNSPWLDIGRCMPSINANAKYDYLDPPGPTGLPLRPLQPDDIWPAKPPRAEIFCNASTMSHPICSPLAAAPEMWKGAPPVFICCGTESLEDEGTAVARRIYQSGGTVDFNLYEGMPHCFAMIFPTTVVGKECLGQWADFCKTVVSEPSKAQRVEHGRRCKPFAKAQVAYDKIDLGTMGVDDEVVKRRMTEMQKHASEREAEAVREYEKSGKAKL
ncbi:hypothetical protein H2198_002728 [Neophaeococcomyces mojaviensis]|uniref:Uncharacterized protein n=1 Tax=Neophaeococcomyces mojaviensis TaxID=3383035 RepID=A0ACC3AE39_9EURO|nr:hypothetical protein H2198_002728 [Knufia sp. JES_112]